MKSYKLGRKKAHRASTLKNIAASVIIYERVVTTLQKAKMAQRIVERVIARAKRYNSPNDYRVAKELLGQDLAAKKMVEVIKKRYDKVDSGYTRIIKLKNRKGDNSLEAILELTIKTDSTQPKDKSVKKSLRESLEVVQSNSSEVKDVSVSQTKNKKIISLTL